MFNIGDKVICINNKVYENILEKNKVYKVLDKNIENIKVVEGYGYFMPERFELVERADKNNKIKIYDNIIKELRDIYVAKNNDYGDSVANTYDTFGDVSFAVRITDKVNRASTLLTKGNQQVSDEKLEDTIKDMINYGILWLIERERTKENIE